MSTALSTVSACDVELEDHDTISIGGHSSDVRSETGNNVTDGEGSILEPNHRPRRNKRAGKRNRQRIQRKLSGLALDSIPECSNPNSSNTPKRTRVATGSTPEMVTKKPRTLAQIVAESTIKKFCVRDNNADNSLDEEKLGIFRVEVSRRILLAAKSSGFVAQMLGCYLVDGVFICKCANDETYKWFVEEISKLGDIWSGCQLSVGDPPTPLIIHTWVPGPPEEPSVVMTNIGLMNPNVPTKGWKIVRHKREVNRQSLVFRVDLKSFDYIMGSGLSLQYVLERISFKIISGP